MGERDSLLSIPKFDGDYEYWAMLMKNLLRSKKWYDEIEIGNTQPERNVILTRRTQKMDLTKLTLKDMKVKNYMFAFIDETILNTIP